MRTFCIAFALATAGIGFAQNSSPWSRTDTSLTALTSPKAMWLENFQTYRIDLDQLKASLNSAPMEVLSNPMHGVDFELPSPEGNFLRFKLVESPILHPRVAKYVPVKTYSVQGIDDRSMTGRLDLGPNGFYGIVRTPKGTFQIDPVSLGNQFESIVYYRHDRTMPNNFRCMTDTAMQRMEDQVKGSWLSGPIALRPDSNLRTYRLAQNATGEYTAVFGSQAAANNAATTSINRVNQVFRIDFSAQLRIDFLTCFTDPNTDPFTNNNGSTMLGQNQTYCDTNYGNANYDIGHVFSTGGGGIAGLGVVGSTGNKARGVTGSPSPFGDPFDIDYVAHEIGHQYGGRHTFNNCSGSADQFSDYEPFSASTIMGYAGICAVNVQPNSDAYLHIASQMEFQPIRLNGAIGLTTANGNLAPTVNAGPDYTIPQNTPYKLTAVGSDPNGDALTYCWEQYDNGNTTSNNPIVRSRIPVTSPTRFFPPLTNVINNTSDPFDLLPTLNRIMNFRCTVRDNRAGGGRFEWDAMVLTISGAQFAVTAPNTAVSWPAGTTQTVTWNVGGGSVAPNVRILLSTNGGNSYGNGTATVLLASTPNDGSQTVNVPNLPTTQARIIVEAVGNVFYDMSNANFTITAATNTTVVPSSLTTELGVVLGGGLSSVQTSDNNRLVILADEFNTDGAVRLQAISPFATLSNYVFEVEGQVSRPNIIIFLEAFDWPANDYTFGNAFVASQTDSTNNITTSVNAGRFLQAGTNTLRSRVRWAPSESYLDSPDWVYAIDYARWVLLP